VAESGERELNSQKGERILGEGGGTSLKRVKRVAKEITAERGKEN